MRTAAMIFGAIEAAWRRQSVDVEHMLDDVMAAVIVPATAGS
jgi:hypothetical protein